MARIGIYGGTFNPIHNGHLCLAKAAQLQMSLDEVWWIPSGNPPHKEDGILGRIPRFEMCELAIRSESGMIVKDFELRRSGECYSYELMEWLALEYPEHSFFFIMGEDSLNLFPKWVRPRRIARLADLVVAVRSTDDAKQQLEKTAEKIREKYDARVHLLQMEDVPIASTELRAMAREGKDISPYVPEPVWKYIQCHKLYQEAAYADMDIAKMTDRLSDRLKPGRFRHTIGVMDTAANLAMRYCMPMDKLRIAGLLHDCAKCYDNKELLSRCKKYGLVVTKAEKRAPHLLHAKVGAYLAEHEYRVKDEDILRAIRVHTTGAPDMDMTSQILFVADYIEPNRNRAVRLEEIRQVAYMDLDVCTLMILEDTIRFLKEKDNPMDSATIDTYDFYKEKVGKFS